MTDASGSPPSRRQLRRRPSVRQLLDGYELELATSSAEAHELVRISFPGLLGFSFNPPERALLSSARVRLDEIYIATVRSSGHDIWLADDDRITILAPLVGTIQVSRRSETRVARPPELLVVGTGERRTSLSPNYLGILAKIPTDLFRQAMRTLTQSEQIGSVDGLGVVRHSTLSHTLRRYLLLLLEELDQSNNLLTHAHARHSAKSFLVDLAAGHWAHGLKSSDSKVRDPGPNSLRSAERFIETNLSNPISIADIADATGISLRALQLMFQKYRRITPHEYLAEARLQKVRELLLNGLPGETVTSLTQAAGIAHSGRFAQSYVRRFGETPFTTLSRAQRRR